VKRTTISVFHGLITALAIVALASCTTTDHIVKFAPPSGDLPVSASSLYATQQGRVVSADEYVVLDHFKFDKVLSGPVGVANYASTLDIGSDLTALAAKSKAEAIVNLRIVPRTYDAGNTSTVGALKIFGGMSLMFAGLFGIMDAALYDPDYPDHTLGGFAIGFGVAGGTSLVTSMMMKSSGTTTWTIDVEGDLVRPK
jgi:hypothetical protein